jgi:hypothetical protein
MSTIGAVDYGGSSGVDQSGVFRTLRLDWTRDLRQLSEDLGAHQIQNVNNWVI